MVRAFCYSVGVERITQVAGETRVCVFFFTISLLCGLKTALFVFVLAVCVLNLQSDGEVVSDTNPHLASCCELIELVLRKGLQQPVLSLVHRDYWQCFEQLPHQDACGRLSALSLAVEQTRGCRKLLSAQGRGRYLLRLALSRKTLPQFITHLLHTPRVLEVVYILLFSNLLQHHNNIIMALVITISIWKKLRSFILSINRRDFVCEIYEVVPCREVGMVLRYLSGRVFVLDLMPGSQAHVDKFICPGDIIDEINGTSLRNSKCGQAGVVLSQLKGRPLSIRVVRWRAQDGTVYRPLVKLLRALRMENPTLQLGPTPSQQSVSQDHRPYPSQCLKEGRQVELFEHHYPEISCVGRFGQPDYTVFAFCVVDSPETPQSTGFCCVALRASTIKECEEIVNRIATGFKHTEWFV
uniref:Uncharacterized protein n=1 Tax=Mastacembelus armatus TaxID=205130 RepID=A0A3Q3KY05_9TELE